MSDSFVLTMAIEDKLDYDDDDDDEWGTKSEMVDTSYDVLNHY